MFPEVLGFLRSILSNARPIGYCFHRYVEQGVYLENWGNHEDYDIEELE